MTKPRIALFLGILFISIFPVLVKMQLNSPLISAFYRMAIASIILIPYVIITKQLHFPSWKYLLPTILCGLIFATDISVWNISIQESSATQATLLTNLAPIWVGVLSFLFLSTKPRPAFWVGTLVAMIGTVIFLGLETFRLLSFDRAFAFGVLSGFLYSLYILISKRVLANVKVLPFIAVSSLSSAVYLLFINLYFGEQFFGYTSQTWISLIAQGLVCQLAAWVLISYATKHMRATRVSLSLLSQVVFAALLAWIFVGEEITMQNIIGGAFILLGIIITFYEPKPRVKALA